MKKLLLICAIFFLGNQFINAQQLLQESFETDGQGTRYTSNPFKASCDFFQRDTNNSIACLTNNPTGLDGSFYWAGEDTDSNPDNTGTGIVTLNAVTVTGLAINVDVLLGLGRPNDGRFEPDDELLFQYNMDGGGWITFVAFYGTNDSTGAHSTGNLLQDTNLNGSYNIGAPEINSFAMQNWNFTIPTTGNNLQVRFVMGQDAGGGEEIIIDNIRINGSVPGPTCSDPAVPAALVATPSTICTGSTSTLTWSGALNDATLWHIYTGSCGGTQVGTSATNSFTTAALTGSTTFYIRGEDGAACVDESTGLCGQIIVNVNALDNASFSYGAAAYCADDSDPSPTITGIGGGTFSSTGSLSINGSTGTVDVSASTPGSYTVTYTTSGLCPNSSNVSFSVNALENASFNYGTSSYCQNNSDPIPTVTGVSGGTFSGSGGLSINSLTGLIDLSVTTPGPYIVTYTTSGSCDNSSNAIVTVNALDDASFSYDAAAYCANDSDPTPTITGLAGGTFSSAPAGLALTPGSGAIDVSASTAGTYTITYTTAGTCPSSSSVSVTVNALDDGSFSYDAAAYCQDASDTTPTITGLAGGTFTSGVGLTINASTGAIDVSVSTPGTYTVTYTTAGVCTNSSDQTVTINITDDASFNYAASAYCQDASDPTPTITGLAGGMFASGAGLNINASTGAIDVSVSTPGTYTVTYTTAGVCANSSDQTVTINITDDASFNYAASAYCQDASDPTPTITGLGSGSFSSAPAGLALTPGTGAIDVSASTAGTYTITYTTAGTCPNSSSVSITVNALDDASFSYDAAAYCSGDTDPNPTITGLASGMFSSTSGLAINPTTGALNISVSTEGTYVVTYTTAGTCPNTSSASVTVNALDDASFSYNTAAYCSDDTDPTPIITVVGGMFTSGAGLSINPTTGAIDVSASTAGTYTVTYTIAGTCPNSSSASVTVNALDDASFSYAAAAYCVDDTNPTPTITGLAGGTFSSAPAGLALTPGTGAIDVSASTAGTYTITYTTAGTCANSSSDSVTVDACAGLECTNAISLASFSCGTSISVLGNTVGGTTSTETGFCRISAGSGGANWYTFISDGARYTASTNNVGTDYGTKIWVYRGVCGALICVNPSTGGTMNSQITFDTFSGETFYIVVGGSGSNEGNYEMSLSKALDTASFTYGATSFCQGESNPTTTIMGLISGTFSSTAGLSIDLNGTINLATSTPGNYNVTFTTNGACPDSTDVSITVNGIDDASFSYPAATYCATDIDTTPTITGFAGGMFSSSAGLSINETTGIIDASTSTLGTYTVTYTTTGTCTNSSNASITIEPCPPINDECTGALLINCGDVVIGSTSFATDSGNNVSNDVFYTFTDTVLQDVSLSLCNSSYDTYVRVFNDCPQTNEIAGNDDSANCSNNQSEVTFTAQANVTYYIMIEGWNTSSGDYEMSLNCITNVPAPGNDLCSSPTTLSLGVTLTGETTAGATDNSTGTLDDTLCDSFTFKSDVWYTFIAPLTGLANVTTVVSGNSDQANVAVYASLDCSQLDADSIVCSSGNGGENIDLTGLSVGQTYYVRVWSDGVVSKNVQLVEGTFDITVTETTLSTTNFNTIGFTYFPNPVDTILTLKSEATISQVRVLNMLGQVVLTETPNTTSKQLDLSNLQSGAYFVEVSMEGTNGNRTKTIRVLKQ
ncbi:T9SS type A sorting domain-containing protein [Lacinutrix jangbogonensis]|uniref:T9SS type A sorting domain-containing protein n=1 Tax=Lacinutrix jangbogonensis TaxID=1469557 RepID=UPI00053EA4E9|nr:T9SS type A sorting domain-containing protein [Lacinutrix jangbogonensis]